MKYKIAAVIFAFLVLGFAGLMVNLPGDQDIRKLEAGRIIPEGRAQENQLQLIWLGVAGVYIGDGETGILIDPFVSRYGMGHVLLDRSISSRKAEREKLYGHLDNLPVDLVIVSHSHYDHALDAPYVANHYQVPLVGSKSTAAIGEAAKTKKIVVAEDDSVLNVGKFKITMRFSDHGKNPVSYFGFKGEIAVGASLSRPSDYKLGSVYAIHIEHTSGVRLVHHASASFLPKTYDGLKADVAILGVALRESSSALIRRVVDDLQVKVIVPIHFDNFFTPEQREMPFVALREFTKTAEEKFPMVKVRFAPFMKKVVISKNLLEN